MNDEKLIQEKYMQFESLQQKVEQVNQNLEYLMQQDAELEISINAIKELSKTKINNELLAPISNGIFLKAELKDNQKLIVNVGSGTTVEKTTDEVIELLEDQKSKVSQKLVETNLLFQQLSNQMTSLYYEIENEALGK